MKISVKIKPTIYKASTKEEVLRKALRGKNKTYTNQGNFYSELFRPENGVYVYTLEKHRAKFKQSRYAQGDKKGQYKGSDRIRQKEWILHLYKIDPNLLDIIKKRVYQRDRTFTFGLFNK